MMANDLIPYIYAANQDPFAVLSHQADPTEDTAYTQLEPLPQSNQHIKSDWMARLQAGDQHAFQHVYSQLQEKVFFFAKRFVESVPDAEDCTAEAFVQLWQRRTQCQTMDEIAAFLHVTVRNKCFDVLRRQQRLHHRLQQLQAEETATPFEHENIYLELLQKIYEEVDLLPPRLKEIFLLSYRDGLKPAQIAGQLQLSVQSVKNQKVTAVRLLKAALGQQPLAMIGLLYSLFAKSS